jgi:hypothetical protein
VSRAFAAGLTLLCWSGPAGAQDCLLRCVTIQQFIGEESVATIPLLCDTAAIVCHGEGTLRISGTTMPVAISARHLLNSLEVRFRTAQPIGTMGETQSFIVPLNVDARQRRNVALRWSTAGERPHVTRFVPGHITIVVERYQPPNPT